MPLEELQYQGRGTVLGTPRRHLIDMLAESAYVPVNRAGYST